MQKEKRKIQEKEN